MMSDESKCVDCQRCVLLCPTHALTIQYFDQVAPHNDNWTLTALQQASETDCKAAFAIAPVDIRSIMAVADAGLTMPPKSTYFDPKPLGGLLIHEL